LVVPPTRRLPLLPYTPLFRSALATIIERHEPLRTCVLNGPSGVRTQSVPVPDRVLAVQDLSRVPAHEQDAAARERIHEEMARPFDLRTGLPIRSLLLRDRKSTRLNSSHVKSSY